MIVVIGGMVRSGSTFSFNIVREILSRKGVVNFASANSLDQLIFDATDHAHFVLKTHAPDAPTLTGILEGVLPCICTIRAPEDAIASWMETFGLPVENGIAMVKQWLSWYSCVSDRVLTLNYQTIETQPRSAIKEIAEFLEINCDNDFVDSLNEQYNKAMLKRHYDSLARDESTIDLGFSYYDKSTFFHRRHISSIETRIATATLSPEELDFIRTELRDFNELLTKRGMSGV